MAHHPFGGADRHAIEKFGDRSAFGGVVEAGGGAVAVDVIDFAGFDARALERCFHRLPRPDAGWIGLGKMKIICRDAIADYLSENRRAPFFSALKIFERKNRHAFAENQTAALAIERPATFRRRRLERIEADKDQLGERVVAAGENTLIPAGPNAFKGVADCVRPRSARVRDDLAGRRDSKRLLRVHYRLLRGVICDQGRRVARR